MTELTGNEVLLLVDDEPAVRRLLRLSLEPRGYRIVEAGDGLEALERLEECGAVDLALLDLSMPRLGGVEALRAMRSRQPDLAAIFMSGHPEPPSLATAPADVPFLAKPFQPDELAEQVRSALEKRRR